MKQARTSDDENDVDAIESEQRHDCGKNSSNDKLQKKKKISASIKIYKEMYRQMSTKMILEKTEGKYYEMSLTLACNIHARIRSLAP